MAFTDNRLSSEKVPGKILPPRSWTRPSKRVAWEMGGVALQDPSEGLQVKVWEARTNGNEIFVYPEGFPSSELGKRVIYDETDISEVSLAFNQNMDQHLAYVSSGQSKLFWFNTEINDFELTVLGADVKSPIVILDDKRDSQLDNSDVLLFYTKNNSLYMKQQRDRFQTEYFLKANVPSNINKIGMSNKLRIQIEMERK